MNFYIEFLSLLNKIFKTAIELIDKLNISLLSHKNIGLKINKFYVFTLKLMQFEMGQVKMTHQSVFTLILNQKKGQVFEENLLE